MLFVYILLLAVVLYFLFKASLIALDIKVDIEFCFKVDCDNMSRTSNSVLQEIFNDSVSRELVYEDGLFLVEAVDFGEGDFNLVGTEVGII